MKKTIEDVFYPPVGIAHITNNLEELLSYKIGNKQKIILNTSAQPNGVPHLGTIMNLTCVFSLAKRFYDRYKIPTTVTFDELENCPGERSVINNIDYCISLGDTYIDGIAKSEYYMKYFMEIMDTLSCLSGIDFKIRTYGEFQKNSNTRRCVLKLFEKYDYFAKLLNPSDELLHFRIKCPKCQWYDKSAQSVEIDKKNNDEIHFSSNCYEHGKYNIVLKEYNDDFIDLNTQLRDLIKGYVMINEDATNDSLTVMVDGGDWGGTWSNRVHCEGLMALGIIDIPIRLFTPIVTDWSGAKFSKSLYMKKGAYSYIDESLINYSVFKDKYGKDGLKKLWEIGEEWTSEPKKFFRNYSIDYFNLILN